MAWYGCSSTWRETTTIVECVHWLYHMAFRMSQSREKYLKTRDMSKIGIICHLVWSKYLKFVIIVTIDYLLSILSLIVQLTAVSIWKQCCLRLNWGVFTRGKVVKRFISHRGQSPSGKYYINTEAEGRGFNESLPHFRTGKPNSTTTKCVTNVKHKDIFPEVWKGFISHVEKWHRSYRISKKTSFFNI